MGVLTAGHSCPHQDRPAGIRPHEFDRDLHAPGEHLDPLDPSDQLVVELPPDRPDAVDPERPRARSILDAADRDVPEHLRRPLRHRAPDVLPLEVMAVTGPGALVVSRAIEVVAPRAPAVDDDACELDRLRRERDLPGPDGIVQAMQRDAIRSAVSTRREPAAGFNAIGGMIARGYQVPTAAQGLRGIPRASWPAESVAAAARDLVAWAGKAHASERTGRDYIETVQVAGLLVDNLPAAEAAPLRATLAGLRVGSFVVRTVVEEMRYDTTRLVVQVGKSFEIIFENPDVMPHNLVVVQPGARQKVGLSAMELPAGHVDRQGRAWVGEDKEIIAASKMLEAGQAETMKITAPRTEGVYEFVCTFPGHWALMHGEIVVTKDVDAYLKANPPPAPAARAVTLLELCDPRLAQPLVSSTVLPSSTL